MKRRKTPWLILLTAGALLASACGPAASGLDLTAEPASPATSTALPANTPDAYRTVEIPEAGIRFEVPGNWQQQGRDWTWTAAGAGAGASGGQVGVRWIDLQPPMEPEAALLPRPSQILGSQPIELPWASGRSFTVSVYGPAPEGSEAQSPVESVETHILVIAAGHGTRRAYDFYAAGSTVKGLDTLEPVLDQMLTSAAPLDGSPAAGAAPSP